MKKSRSVAKPILISLIIAIVLCVIVSNIIMRYPEIFEGQEQAGSDLYGMGTAIFTLLICLSIVLISITIGFIISYFRTKRRDVLIFMIVLIILTILYLIWLVSKLLIFLRF